jgi:GNAT superfamily N-acetyltransferase
MLISGEIRYQLEGGRYATLRFREDAERIHLDLVLVPSQDRGRGVGGFLVSRLLAFADLAGKAVDAVARPVGQSGPGTLARLVDYYSRFGFETIERRISSVALVRWPTSLAGGEFPRVLAEPTHR